LKVNQLSYHFSPSLNQGLEAFAAVEDLEELLETLFEHIFKSPKVIFANVIYFYNNGNLVPLGHALRCPPNGALKIYTDTWLLDGFCSRFTLRLSFPRSHRAVPILLRDGSRETGLIYIGFNFEPVFPNELVYLQELSKIFALRLSAIMLEKEKTELKEQIEQAFNASKENMRLLYDITKQLYATTAISTRITERCDYRSFLKKINSKITSIFSCDGIAVYRAMAGGKQLHMLYKTCSKLTQRDANILNRAVRAALNGEIKLTIVNLSAENCLEYYLYGDISYSTIAIAPLISKGIVKGALVLLHKNSKVYDADSMRLLSGITSMLATALHNIFLYNQMRKEKGKLRFLLDSVSHFTDTLDLGETLKSIVKAAATFVGNFGVIYLISRSKVPLVVLSRSKPGEDSLDVYDTLESGALRYLLRYFESTKRAMVVNNVRRTQKIPHSVIKNLGLWNATGFIGVPLKLKAQTMGLLIICTMDKRRTYSYADMELVKGLADAAAVSIKNSQIYSTAQELSDFLEKKIVEKEKLSLVHSAHTIDPGEGGQYLVFRLDLKGNFVFVNKTMELKTGYSKEMFYTGKLSPIDLIVSEDRNKLKTAIRSIIKGTVRMLYDLEFNFINSKGEKIVLSMNMYPDKDRGGKIIGLEAVCKDITARKILEEELFRSKELALIGEFSGAMAHQIRNPLSQIYVGLRRLQMGMEKHGWGNCSESDSLGVTGVEAEYQKIISETIRNVTQLEKFIREVLEYTKSLRLCVTRQRLDQIIIEAVNDFSGRAKERGVTIETSFLGKEPLVPEVDALLLGQAFRNIIQNALEAIEGEGKVQVIMGPLEENSNYAKVVFKDTGKGIPREHIEKIFLPFFTTKPQGTGLGLSFAYKVVKAHKGRMWAESDGKEGTQISVVIPVKFDGNANKGGMGYGEIHFGG